MAAALRRMPHATCRIAPHTPSPHPLSAQSQWVYYLWNLLPTNVISRTLDTLASHTTPYAVSDSDSVSFSVSRTGVGVSSTPSLGVRQVAYIGIPGNSTIQYPQYPALPTHYPRLGLGTLCDSKNIIKFTRLS